MLPKQLKYGSKVESAMMAQSYRSNIQPQNGTGPYGLGQTIIFNIPTANNLVLAPTESYLKFSLTIVNNATVGAAIWDSCGAHSLVSRLRIFHGSNLLQDIDQYGLLSKMLFDLSVPTDACYGKFNELAGTRGDTVGQYTTGAAFAATTTTYITSNQINSGEYYSLASNATTTRTFCLNLISLLGTLSPQYLPLFAMTSAPLRMEIQLVSNINQAIASTSTLSSIALNNVEYIGQFIKLSDNAMSMIYGSLGGQPLEFSVPDYSNYQYTYSTLPVDKGTGTDTFFPFSCITGGISNYFFRIGSNIVPTKAPDSLPEMFSECIKAIGSMSDLNHQPSIEKVSYELASSTALTTGNFAAINSGSFYLAIDLENYPSASKDQIFAGYNSNTDDIFAVINLSPAAAFAPRFDAFANFDSVLVFENGTAYRKF
eukprot:gene17375-23998_t